MSNPVCHLQTNSQVEQYSCTIVAILRHYLSDHQKEFDVYSQPLTHGYSMQTHKALGTAPLNVIRPGELQWAAAFDNLTGSASNMPIDNAPSHMTHRIL